MSGIKKGLGEKEKEQKKKIATQVIGNIGLYYICYKLCRRGWNVMPTSRNARGIDIVIYSQDGKRTHTIQAKSLTKRSPVPIGSNLENLFADYLIICRGVLEDNPEIFIASIDKIKPHIHKGIKNNKVSYWLQQKDYEQYKDNWKDIGYGYPISLPMKINP